MDSAALHSSAQQMIEDLKQRMDYFEAELRSNTNPSPTITTLAAEYASFKNFTLTALRALQEQVELAAQSIDQLEMRGRRKILLIHGVPEEQREDTASFGISNCWTREGNVYVVGPDGSRHRVNWLGDLHKLVGQLQLEPVVVAASSRPPVASLKPANSNDLGTVAPVTRRAAAIASKK
ncbi:Uncharacterized protein OBRU01_21958 [Operophtera brumata]|uniref:Uncharacterized protein n=1 Tax=Operophtera brumata TaxID=104452 RepID=A0A0L7KS98_OPEBR|nr:Uncharacterized protein OBRU01_21958 [Operophtera brumata]